MSTISMTISYGYSPPPLFNPYHNRGVSEDASTIQNRISGISDDFSYSIVLGSTLLQISKSLQEAFRECSVDNWDGYGAKAIDVNSYSEALRFIHSLPNEMPIPEITVDPDGEVVLEWHNGRNRIFSVSIGGKGDLTYAGIFGRNKAHGTEYFGDEFPKTILDSIERIFI